MKSLLIIKRTAIFFGIFFLLNISIFAQEDEIIEIGNVYSGEIEFAAFELLEASTIEIEGKAANFGGTFTGNEVFYGWILDSETRQIVWDAREAIDFDDEDGMYDIVDQENLDAGKYEVYYTCSENSNIDINNLNEFFSRFFSRSKTRFNKKHRSKLGLTVTGEKGKFFEIDPVNTVDALVKNSIVSFTRVMHDEDLEAGFSLKDNTEIRIYSIGESRKNSPFDVAWITNVKTNKLVWKASRENSSFAGGGSKNYLVDEKIELPKGSYLVHFTSDDSHSFEEWNVLPPDDPQFWGVTLWAATDKDKMNVIPFREEDIVKPIVDLTKVRDDEFLSQGFRVGKDTEFSLLCLGEGNDSDDLRDFGWIINADTKETIWSMNDNVNIKHAGGLKKNVMVEETLKLEKGNYIAFYSTDDSHSYKEWNASSPFQKEKWGLSIWTDEKNIQLFNESDFKSESVIAEIIRVKENRNIRKEFSLAKDTNVRVIAIGEGDRFEMNDYGWLKDNNGNIIWEMSYGITRKAGGATKNRLFNNTISLEAGKYTLHYKTDDSHSYNSWNSSPPTNQENYGITLMIED
ncbi:MAG: hypothetical protein GY936_03640 [Ignavibacteriae bacterium]|nr:hypothetical protein [Ignavibacteriota bacterium]